MCKANPSIQVAVCVLIMTLAAGAAGRTIHVDPNGSADFTSIQAAIDDANDGDAIEVAPGTYNEAIDIGGKAIRLYSSGGREVTTINGTGNYHVVQCVSGEDANTILVGFTITGGNADGLGSNNQGGGMYNKSSSPTVTNCTFSGNTAGYGGGMLNDASSPIVTDCNFTNNNATSYGGGMENFNGSFVTVTNCTFSGNTAFQGGGMINNGSSPTVTDCLFAENTANADGGGMYNYPNSSPTMTDCIFRANTANYGGGMYNRQNSNPAMTNCTFSGNSANYGGAMVNWENSSPTVTDCLFAENTANADGGGIYNYPNSSPTVSNCIFRANTANYGGGMYSRQDSAPTVTNCLFTENTANADGGGMYNYINSSSMVSNCIFRANTANYGGGMYNRQNSNPTVTNCTFSDNSSEVGGAMVNWDNSHPTVTNCILWDNIPNVIFNDPSSASVVTYSDIQGGWPGAGNINAAPLFVDAANGDLRLGDWSVCVDAGKNDAVSADTADLDGDSNTGEPLPFDFGGDARFVDDANVTDTGSGTPPIVDMGAYERQSDSSPCPEPVYVYNRTQEVAFVKIQAAIDDANDGDEIEVAPMIFYEAIDFKGKAIRLYSSAGPEVTTINGNGAYHVVQCVNGEGPGTILEGFTITGGNAKGVGPDGCGGGMYNNSSPTVSNCLFTENSASADGGGMYNYPNSNPTVTNCIFRANTANYGGGMYNRQNSNPTMTNCTFSGNSSVVGGAMVNWDNSSPKVTNCILWGNIPNGIFDDPSSASVVTYSDVQGGRSGEGNINKNPLLSYVTGGNLSLVPWSPCIDKGSNAAVASYATDIAGLPRLVDGDCNGTVIVDMGAHEFRHAYGGDFDSSCLVNMADYAVLAWAWLASPQSENWDPVCDISIPADRRVDAGDVKVLIGNWLGDVDTPITCDTNRLKNIFGLDAAGAAYVLKELCGITDTFTIEQMLYAGGYEPDEYLEFTAVETVRKFAPVLYFDRAHKGLPMSAQVYFQTIMSASTDPAAGTITWTTPWDGPCYPKCWECGAMVVDGRDESNCGMQNNDFSTLTSGHVPTYYKVISDIDSTVNTGTMGRLRIAYWWFYGFQSWCHDLTCTGSTAEHHGDWEFIWVTTDPSRSRADAVTYCFHGVWYTRRWPGGFYRKGDRPVVYVGKISHGNYHNDDHSGWMDGTPSHCCHYADYRDQTEASKWYNTYDNLVSLRNSEPWMQADRIGSLYEYGGRKYRIDKWRWGPHISYKGWGCAWEHITACGTHPTWHTQAGQDYSLDWIQSSCKAEGCGADTCYGLAYDYPQPDYNQGWPWESSSMSSASEPATRATGGAVASCGRCGVSRLAAMARLGEYWLAIP